MSRQVPVDGRVVQATESAVCVRMNDTLRKTEIWFPRSVLLDGNHLDINDTDIECAEWFAQTKGLA